MNSNNENQIVEWKESWHDRYLEWICNYANAQGGNLYIGIDDDGNVVDLKDIKKLLEDIPNIITSGLAITCDVNQKNQGNKPYIEIVTRKSPHLTNFRGHYYYHTGNIKRNLQGLN